MVVIQIVKVLILTYLIVILKLVNYKLIHCNAKTHI